MDESVRKSSKDSEAGGPIFTASNDCTVRQWELTTGNCLNVFKFIDPVFALKFSPQMDVLYCACWDKMIRCLDLKENAIVKAFVAA
mmetsp:Transcript_15844/g.24378  ORF Transcript_15844/g.24378 Transcript_15844/m.24378 type:complete len:86 (+) Transcript_15844:471-728(+)